MLTDFGVARMANATIRTASGAIVGTPAYMSPEQISGTAVDARSDIYALGVVLYEMLSGRLPFAGEEDTVASALIRHITETPQALPEAPQAVQAVVFRALSKDRNDRYQKASEMAMALRAALGVPLGTREMEMLKASSKMPTPTDLSTKTIRLGTRQARSTRTLWTVMLISVLIVAVGVGILLGTGVLNQDDDQTTEVSDSGAPVVPEETFGVLIFNSDSGETVDQVQLTVKGLAQPAEGMHYETWLLGPETRRSMGMLEVDENGSGVLTFKDENGENLLATFASFEITLEPSPDPNRLPTGDAIYSSAVPPGPLGHIRHLLTAFGRSPDGGGLVINLLKHARQITTTAQAMAVAVEDDDFDELKLQAEGLVNLIEGTGGDNFGDLDGDGEVTNPGDGFGLLPGAQSAGYIQTAIEHANFAAGTDDATVDAITHAGLLEIAGQNLGGWAGQLEEAALAIVASEDTDAAKEYVEQISELADLFTNGQDVNGNGEIEPILDEGGAMTVFLNAQLMAEMPVLIGMNRVPAPASANPVPSTGMSIDHEAGAPDESYE